MTSIQTPVKKQEKLINTCVECRRRKIRCDGNRPCDKCVYYMVPLCEYAPRKRRRVASQVANSNGGSIQASTLSDAIVDKLFPSQPREHLLRLSRSELLDLAQELSRTTQGPVDQPSFASQEPDMDDLDSTEDDDRAWIEPQDRDAEEAQCDDVNGLSLDIRKRSYMGNSSVVAIFKAMFRLRPSLQSELRARILNFKLGPHNASPAAAATTSPSDMELRGMTPSVGEAPSVNAYFAHIQGIIPILDEAEFRQMWAARQRTDRPWLALLNMVLALGSLAIGDSDESCSIYYARAKEYLDLELLGVGCTESLQALCLLGGVYLHYKNAPNMAYAIMGASYRIAISLGLHRQPSHPSGSTPKSGVSGKSALRRRLWWSLFCLDSWGSTTLGRPTLGRWDPQTMDVRVASEAERSDPFELALDCAREFCAIATKVQHRLCQLRPITIDEIRSFDTELLHWYSNLPFEFQRLENCPAFLVTGQDIMRNRYFNLRLLLHRPVLIRHCTLDSMALGALPQDEQDAIQICRDIACEAIDRVSLAMNNVNRLRAWSSVWYLYQSSMVLLLSILMEPQHPQSTRWRASVERALQFFSFANLLTVSAGRSRNVISSLLDACTQASIPTPMMPVQEATKPMDPNALIAAGPSHPVSAVNLSIWNDLQFDVLAEQVGGDWDMSNWPTEMGGSVDWTGGPPMQ